MVSGSFLGELKRRNVLRAAILYIGVIWALSQGAAQLLPVFDVPNWVVRAFVIAGIVGFPFWLAFAWFYELTPQGLRRESDVAPDASIARRTGRKLDFAIIGVLTIAVVLLLTDRFIAHRGDGENVSDKSIAVMPLVNMSGDQSNEYFSDGVSEELINTLAKVRDLTVIGRNSSFQFKGKLDDTKTIAAKLGVAYLLEGSVRKASDRVRIAVNLVRASNSVDVWSETYDRDLKDVFAVQSDIASSVANKLQAVLGASARELKPEAPPSGSVEAYTAYLQGRFHAERADEEGLSKAIQYFQTATRLDPDYAEAWARMASALGLLGADYRSNEQAMPLYAQARRAIDTALRLRPDLAWAHIAKAQLALSEDFDWRTEKAEYRRAIELDPQNTQAKLSLSLSLTTAGEIRQAIDAVRPALVTDPMIARVHSLLGSNLLLLNQLQEGEAELRKAVELQPAAMTPRIWLVINAVLRNDFAAAMQCTDAFPPDSNWWRYTRAIALQIGPDRAAADAGLQALIDKNADAMSYQIASVYAIRGDADKTFEWLGKAWKTHDPGLTFLLFDPFTLRFKDDPRYVEVVRTVGLPVANLATTQTVPYRGR